MLSQDKINSLQQFILNNQPNTGVSFKGSGQTQVLASSHHNQASKKHGPSKSIRGVDKLLNASLNQHQRSKSNGRSSNQYHKLTGQPLKTGLLDSSTARDSSVVSQLVNIYHNQATKKKQ